MIRTLTTIALTALMPGAATGSPRPAVALTASPPHLILTGADRRLIRVANPGAEPVVVDATPAGFSLGAHGGPQVSFSGSAARQAAAWLEARPSRVVLPSGATTELALASRPPSSASPGDHPAVLLLTTHPSGVAGVAVRMQIGVTVVVRVAGTIRHGLAVRAFRARSLGSRRVLELVIANTGNVVERLGPGRLRISLFSPHGPAGKLRPRRRELLPRSSATFELRYPRLLRGSVRVRVALSQVPGRVHLRNFWIRL